MFVWDVYIQYYFNKTETTHAQMHDIDRINKIDNGLFPSSSGGKPVFQNCNENKTLSIYDASIGTILYYVYIWEV